MQSKQQLHAMALAALGLTACTVMASTTAQAAPLANKAAQAGRATQTQITQVTVTPEARGTRIVIVGTQPFTPKVETVGRPSATVISIDGSWGAGRQGYTNVRQNGIWNVRYGLFAARPRNQVRVVANTRARLAVSTQGSPDRTRWEVIIWAPGVAATAVTDSTAPATTAPLAPVGKPQVANMAAKPGVVTPAALRTVATAPADLKHPVTATAQPKANPVVPPAVVAAVTPKPTTMSFSGASTAPAPIKPGAYPALLAAPTAPAAPAAEEGQGGAPPVSVRSGATASTATSVVQQDPNAKRVSIDVVAADINDVLKALSKQSGINIVTGNDVKGNITVTLSRVSLIEALDMVTRLSGYTYAKFGNAYVVGSPASVGSLTASQSGPEQTTTEFIPYRYTTPVVLNKALESRFPKLKLPVADDKDTGVRQRTLIVTDTPAHIAEIRSFIEKLEMASTSPSTDSTTEVYKIKYASPADLISILGRLVPTVNIQLGPTQGFIPNSTGASVSFSTSSTPAGGGSGGQSPAGGTGAPATGAAGGAGNTNQATTLLITGAPADIAKARDVLTQIDLRTPQIIFEAQVVDISEGDLVRYGFTYDFSRPVTIGEANGGTGSASSGSGNNVTTARDMKFGAILRSPYTFTTVFDALATNDKNRILAKPNLSALDGQPATVFIGDQIKYVTLIQQTQQGQVVQTETATVGITLKVTGKTSPDGTITLYVHPEVSVISDFLELTNGISLPQISTRFVDTTVRVKDGETIAIGGLIRESEIKNMQKVPLLGDIPVLGQLFRRTSRQRANSNVVIFITSRVLKD